MVSADQHDIYAPYEIGLCRLLERIGQGHRRYLEALGYQHRLTENIAQSRRYGDKEARQTDRTEIIDRLNELAQSELGVSFNDLCDSNLSTAMLELVKLVEQQNWTEILRIVENRDPDYTGPNGRSIRDIRKQARYARGKELEEADPRCAYELLYAVYEKDPDYEDVAKLCAGIAFRIGTCQDVSMGWKQRVEWLEKVIEVTPDYGEGRAREALDDSRYHWAEQILDRDMPTAAAQLERISRDYTRWPEVYQKLVDVYCGLLGEGNYVRTEWSNTDAEAEARFHLGTKRWGKGDLPGAIEQLGNVCEEAQEFQSAQLALAQICQALGDKEYEKGHLQGALEWYEKAVAIQRALRVKFAFPSAQSALARIYWILGEKERQEGHWLDALQWYKKAQAMRRGLKEEFG